MNRVLIVDDKANNLAVKFTPEGGHVELRCERQDEQVIIEVSDSGIGIEPGCGQDI